MNDIFSEQKEKLIAINQEISLLRRQVNYLLRNEKPLGLLDLDVLMNRTHTVYDMLCAIQMNDSGEDDELGLDADDFASLFGDLSQQETENPMEGGEETPEADAPVEEENHEEDMPIEGEKRDDDLAEEVVEETADLGEEVVEETVYMEETPEMIVPEEDALEEQAPEEAAPVVDQQDSELVEPEPAHETPTFASDEFGLFFRFDDEPQDEPQSEAEPELQLEPQSEAEPELQLEPQSETEPELQPESVDEPQTESQFEPQPETVEETQVNQFEDNPIVTDEGKVVHFVEEIPEEDIPARDLVDGNELQRDNPFDMPHMEDNSEEEFGFELAQPETLGESLMREDHSLAARFRQNPVRDLKSAIGINDKFLFVNELFGGSMEKYNKSIENLNDLKTLNGATIYLNELKVGLQWNSSNEAYQRLAELVRRKFD